MAAALFEGGKGMTIAEALERVKRDRPGEATDAELRKWLAELDERWRLEVIDTHWPSLREMAEAQADAQEDETDGAETDGAETDGAETDGAETDDAEDDTDDAEDETDDSSTELLIPSPDDEVYIYWLYAHIDLRLGETDRYNNSATLYNAAWQQAAKRYNRTHMPKGRQLRHIVYGARPFPRGGEDPLDQRRW